MSSKSKMRLSPNAWAYHDAEQYYVGIELPGVAKDDIDIQASDYSLCVVAPRADYDYVTCYNLAHRVDPTKIQAEYEMGVLSLRIPFIEKTTTVTVKIK